ncbi:MAG: hypothetical protein JWM87_3821 [Candidatus Eremiobacteraeota bacterium]|nr:hypothetical protein [Candidatus Eremiobacteraeota bacterium]
MEIAISNGGPSVDVGVLDGTFTVGGEPETLAPREHAFIALLAVSPRPRSAANLAEALWPERDPEAARKCAKVYANRVRMRLGRRDAVMCGPRGYQLGIAVRADTHRIEAMIARAKTRGVLGPDRPRANDALERLAAVAEPVRRVAELERYFARLASELASLVFEDAWRRRDYHGAAGAGLQLAAFDPCEELGRELVIRAQLALGDELGAVRTYRDYARTLRDELDAEPSERVRALIT